MASFSRLAPRRLPCPRYPNRGARQQHDRNRVPREPLLQAFGRAVILYLADHQRVEPGDFRIRHCDVGPGGLGLLVLKRVTNQESVDGLLPAVEPVETVVSLQFFDPESHLKRNAVHLMVGTTTLPMSPFGGRFPVTPLNRPICAYFAVGF